MEAAGTARSPSDELDAAPVREPAPPRVPSASASKSARAAGRYRVKVLPWASALSGCDDATEQERDLAADGQSKAGAAVLAAGGAVRLLQRPEDCLQLLAGDTDPGVFDPEGDHRTVPEHGFGQLSLVRGFDPQFHSAALGEFDRVGEQVAQHLPQPGVVGDEVQRDAGAVVMVESRLFCVVIGRNVAST